MALAQPLTNIERKPLALVLDGIDSSDAEVSKSAGIRLCNKAKEYGLNVRDYLNLAVDVRASNDDSGHNPFTKSDGEYLSGYKATLSHLNIPYKNDLEQGILLQAASDTFQYKPGSRALFPEVIDDMLRWQTKQDQIQTTSGMVAQSRTINGVELQTRAIMDDDQDELSNSIIAEFGNFPVQTITDTEHGIKFYKFGGAIRTSYEFNRRVTMDVLTPYAARVERKKELDKVAAATAMLLNGDSVYGAAPVEPITAYQGDVAGGKTLKDNYIALLKFLTKRAQMGFPVDTIVGNFDMYVELFLMFTPTTNGTSVAEHLQMHGGPKVRMALDLLQGVKFEISGACPEGKLICYSQMDTLEELTENGSAISESEQAIKNQSITYTRSINHAYRLIFGDTRVVLDTQA